MIRPSGEMRLSNFLLWQVAYSELWITNVLWPDFRPQHLFKLFMISKIETVGLVVWIQKTNKVWWQ